MENIKRDLLLLNNLKSENPKEIAEAIIKIKETGNIQYIPYLIEKLNLVSNNEIRKQISTFLHSIKEVKVVVFYLEAIKNGKNRNILKDLIQFCWEGGFDLAPYGEVFINVVIEEEYEIAIEAFTVIEENLMNFSEEQKKQYSSLLKEKLSETDEVKKAFIVELIKLLE